jgi:hypothetical protein
MIANMNDSFQQKVNATSQGVPASSRDTPPGVGWQFGRAFHAQACSLVAVAELGR